MQTEELKHEDIVKETSIDKRNENGKMMKKDLKENTQIDMFRKEEGR